MTKSWKKRYRQLIDAGFALHGLALWERGPAEHGYLVDIGDGGPPLAASIMGAGGLDYGVLALSGPRAFADMIALCERSASTDEISLLSVSMTPLSELDASLRPLYRGRGGRSRSRSVPYPLMKRPAQRGREPDARELETLLLLVNGLRAAAEQDLLDPRPFVLGGQVQKLTFRGSLETPSVEAALVDAPAAPEAPSVLNRRIVPLDLARLPQLDASWSVGLIETPMVVEDDPRSIAMFVVLDTRTEMILHGAPIHGFDLDAAVEALASVLRGQGIAGVKGRPRRLDVCGSRRLYEAVRALLGPLKIPCRLRPGDEQFERVSASLLGLVASPAMAAASEALGGLFPEEGPSLFGGADLSAGIDSFDAFDSLFGGEDLEEEEDELPRPAPRDVDGWFSWAFYLTDRFDDEVACLDLHRKRRPLQRYFGDWQRGVALLDDPFAIALNEAYVEWAAVFYRATRRSRTIGEKVLLEDLGATARELLEARAGGRPTLLRVTEAEQGGRLRALDLISGGEGTFYRAADDEPVCPGEVLPVSVFPAGECRLLCPLGPRIARGQEKAALRFLEGEGLALTPAGLAERTHLLGRLWTWEGLNRF